MLEVWRSRQRIDDVGWKSLGENPLKARAELLAAHADFRPRSFFADELELHRLGAAEFADFEQDATRQIRPIRPTMYDCVLSCSSQFVLEPSETGEPFAVFMHFGGARGGELSERTLERVPRVGIHFHRRDLCYQAGDGSAAIVVRGP